MESDLDDLTDQFFAGPSPIAEKSNDGEGVFADLTLVERSSAVVEAVAHLYHHLQHQYEQSDQALEASIADLRERQESELGSLIAGTPSTVVNSDTVSSVIARHCREIDDATRDKEAILQKALRTLRSDFASFLSVSSADAQSMSTTDRADAVEALSVAGPDCSTAKITNPLRGTLVGARPRDPSISAVVVQVHVLNALSVTLFQTGNHEEQLRRLGHRRHSLVVVPQGMPLPQPTQPDIVFRGGPVEVGSVSIASTAMDGGANMVAFLPLEQWDVDTLRHLLAFASVCSVDALSVALNDLEHCKAAIPALVEAIAATQIELGITRFSNAWWVPAIYRDAGAECTHLKTISTGSNVAYNLPMSIRLFLPAPSLDLAKQLLHRCLDGTGIEWSP